MPFDLCGSLEMSPAGFPKISAEFGRDGAIVAPSSCAKGEANMATGTVKFFNGQKGFGFIQQSDGGPDVFVHVTAVERAGLRGLVEGQKLSFDIVTERGKAAASNLQEA
jgi:CspA family cold shock protein